MNKKIVAITIIALLVTCAPVMASPFPDLEPTHWVYDQVNILYAAGLLYGYPDGTIKVSQDMTRAEAFRLIGDTFQYLNDRIDAIKDRELVKEDPDVTEKYLRTIVQEALVEQIGPYVDEEMIDEVIAAIAEMKEKYDEELAKLARDLAALDIKIDDEIARLEGDLKEQGLTIDELKEYGIDIEDLQAKYDALQETIDLIDATGDVKALRGVIGDLEASVKDLGSGLDALRRALNLSRTEFTGEIERIDSAIARLRQQISDIIGADIDELEGLLSGEIGRVDSDIDSLRQEILKLRYTDLKALEDELAKHVIETELMKAELLAELEEMRARFTEEFAVVTDRIDELDLRMDQVDAKVDEVDSKVDAVDAKVDDVDAKVDAVDAKVDAVDAKVDAVDEKVDAVDEKVDAVDEKVDAVDAKVDDVDAKVDAVDKKVDQVEDKVDELDQKVDDEVAKLIQEIARVEEKSDAADEEIRSTLEQTIARIDSMAKALDRVNISGTSRVVLNVAFGDNIPGVPGDAFRHELDVNLNVSPDEDVSLDLGFTTMNTFTGQLGLLDVDNLRAQLDTADFRAVLGPSGPVTISDLILANWAANGLTFDLKSGAMAGTQLLMLQEPGISDNYLLGGNVSLGLGGMMDTSAVFAGVLDRTTKDMVDGIVGGSVQARMLDDRFTVKADVAASVKEGNEDVNAYNLVASGSIESLSITAQVAGTHADYSILPLVNNHAKLGTAAGTSLTRADFAMPVKWLEGLTARAGISILTPDGAPAERTTRYGANYVLPFDAMGGRLDVDIQRSITDNVPTDTGHVKGIWADLIPRSNLTVGYVVEPADTKTIVDFDWEIVDDFKIAGGYSMGETEQVTKLKVGYGFPMAGFNTQLSLDHEATTPLPLPSIAVTDTKVGLLLNRPLTPSTAFNIDIKAFNQQDAVGDIKTAASAGASLVVNF